MKILAIDPGSEQSAYVIYDTDQKRVGQSDTCPNDMLLDRITRLRTAFFSEVHAMVIEKVACMGMAVGADVFETVFYSGRFAQAWGLGRFARVTRHEVKMHLCGSMRAKDSNIRQALIDKLGPIGTKKNPGPCYGISKHLWSALAVAVTWHEQNAK